MRKNKTWHTREREREAMIEVINKPSTVCNISQRGDGQEQEGLSESEREMENCWSTHIKCRCLLFDTVKYYTLDEGEGRVSQMGLK